MFRTLTGRLTAWYAGLFIVLVLILFGLFYWTLSTRLLARVDDELQEDAREIVELIEVGGDDVGMLRSSLAEEIDSSDADREFIRIITAGGDVVAATDLEAWTGLDDALSTRLLRAGNEEFLFTIKLPERDDSVRVISRRMDDGTTVQIGLSREDDEELLEVLLDIFGAVAGVMMFLGGVLGWFMARRALKGVERVTDTALRIEEGDLSRRVALGNEGAEIERLADAFNRMLEQIQRLVSELKEVTQNIAHDLRSPVTRIRGVCETTLRSDGDTEEYREMAATVVEEADRLVNMINIMMEIAESDSGVAQLSRAPVDLNELVHDVAELYEPLAEDNGIVITVDAASPDAVVQGDGPRLQRVLANLVDNAVKYTPAEGSILLHTEATDDAVVVSVKDTGIGMDGETRAKAFDRFYRGDRSRSRPGNGLGLSLARAFVRLHGGDITVQNPGSQGTEFLVVLPRNGG